MQNEHPKSIGLTATGLPCEVGWVDFLDNKIFQMSHDVVQMTYINTNKKTFSCENYFGR